MHYSASAHTISRCCSIFCLYSIEVCIPHPVCWYAKIRGDFLKSGETNFDRGAYKSWWLFGIFPGDFSATELGWGLNVKLVPTFAKALQSIWYNYFNACPSPPPLLMEKCQTTTKQLAKIKTKYSIEPDKSKGVYTAKGIYDAYRRNEIIVLDKWQITWSSMFYKIKTLPVELLDVIRNWWGWKTPCPESWAQIIPNFVSSECPYCKLCVPWGPNHFLTACSVKSELCVDSPGLTGWSGDLELLGEWSLPEIEALLRNLRSLVNQPTVRTPVTLSVEDVRSIESNTVELLERGRKFLTTVPVSPDTLDPHWKEKERFLNSDVITLSRGL